MIFGGQRFQCLIDTGADRTVLRKKEVQTNKDLIAKPPIMEVGRRSMSQEMASPITWVGPNRDKGKSRPLIFQGLSANLLGQDLLGQTYAVITTDHLAIYDDKTEQGVIRQTPDTWIHPQK